MAKVVVVYHSGYGHTQFIAQAVAQGAGADLIAVDAEGNLPEGAWEALAAADAIVKGTPQSTSSTLCKATALVEDRRGAVRYREAPREIGGVCQSVERALGEARDLREAAGEQRCAGAFAQPAPDHGGMGRHPPPLGQDADGRMHPANILWRGLTAHQNTGLTARGRGLRCGGGEHDFARRAPR